MELKEIREKIDGIDDEIVKLYSERLKLVKAVAEEKKKTGGAIKDISREKDIVYRLTEKVEDDYKLLVKELYSAIFSLSKSYQSTITDKESVTAAKLKKLVGEDKKPFPVSATVACQGVLGANSYSAACKLFPISGITYFKTFEGVFSAVEKGLCEYGVLPIENSTAGSIGEVYDLMKKYRFHIVRSVRLKISHCLAAVKGVKKEDVKRVLSHPQALSQCKEYLKNAGYIPVAADNTAAAAKELALSKKADEAVLCSEECADIYGLEVLQSKVEDNPSNYTRFICIAKDLKVFEGSDKISVMTSIKHEAGSLNEMLSRFSSLGLNLTKIESRPIPDAPFEFMFYLDFDGNVNDKKIISLIGELESDSDNFVFLGCYKEIK